MTGYTSLESVNCDNMAVSSERTTLWEVFRLAESRGWKPSDVFRDEAFSATPDDPSLVGEADARSLTVALEGAVSGRIVPESDNPYEKSPDPVADEAADDWEDLVRRVAALAARGSFRIVIEVF